MGDIAVLRAQTKRLGITKFRKKGIAGRGIRIAVFDTGFPGVEEAPEFDHILANNRVIETWDFVRNTGNAFVGGQHGTMVLSCIAGMYQDSIPIGLATEAEFLLARTERTSFERFSEEENWIAAAEWADQNGAHIINSSLGYTHNRYFKEDMDGKTTLVSRGANMAARKGILVVNAAGNEGTSKWKRIGSPADADSVLSIGGISPYSGYHVNFSSYGPTEDKRMKPNVSAFGIVVARGKKGISAPSGTSFASPLIAGFAACALQAKSSLKNMELFTEIQRAGDLYPYFDYAHGYGVPRADYFLEELPESEDPIYSLDLSGDVLRIKVKDELFANDLPEDGMARKSGTLDKPKSGVYETKPELLFYHIENEQGYLDSYSVLSVYRSDVKDFYLPNIGQGKTIRVHFMGHTQEYTVK